MCGLVGAAGQLIPKDDNVIRTLLVLDTLRGVDSTGLSVISRDGDVKTVKALGHAFNLIESAAYDKALTGANKCFIGHNRYATQGKISTRNAHPYEYGKVVGAHNGTIKNKYGLEDGYKFDVDSQALINHISVKGIESAVSIVDGAYALTWYDTEEDTLNFIRNSERPLFIAITEEENKIYWASEKWMLSVALSRCDVKYKEISELPENIHLSFQFANNGMLQKPHAKEVKQPAKPLPFSGGASAKDVSGITPFQINTEYRFEVIGGGVDSSNNRYYMLQCRTYPEQRVRLYRHRSDTVELMNRIVFAKLHQYKFSDSLGLYLKAEHSTVRLENVIGEATKKVVEEQSNVSDLFFPDNKGRLIDRNTWHKRHGTCGWCQGHVNPNMAHKFTVEGDSLCQLCCEDTEVLQYVNVQ